MARSQYQILGGDAVLERDVLLRYLHVQKGDIVSLSGTLIEGIGNRLSDIDINVIKKKRLQYHEVQDKMHAFVHRPDMQMCTDHNEDVFMTMDYYPRSEFHFDVEYWTYNEIEDIAVRIENEYRHLLTHSDSNYIEKGLSKLEKLLVHRSFCGEIIFGDEHWKDQLTQQLREKFAYNQYREIANNYWDFKDICGALDVKNNQMSCERSRDYLIREIRGAIFLNGITNPTQKWFLDYWRKVSKWGYEHIYDKSISLLFSVNVEEADLYVDQVLSVVEDIEKINREKVADSEKFLSSEKCIEFLNEEREIRKTSHTPVQEHEFNFRLRTFTSDAPRYSEILKIL